MFVCDSSGSLNLAMLLNCEDGFMVLGSKELI